MRCTLGLHLIEVVAHQIKPVQYASHLFERQIIHMISVASGSNRKQQMPFAPECFQIAAQLPQEEDKIVLVASAPVIGSLASRHRVFPVNVQSVETVFLYYL